MYYTLLRLYVQGSLSKAGLKNAVAKGWISETEYEDITGDEYAAN
jgi:hypothetical protein